MAVFPAALVLGSNLRREVVRCREIAGKQEDGQEDPERHGVSMHPGRAHEVAE
jgi:hypothetical protein